MPFDTRISTLNEYQLTVCPDNVLALVEALELKEEQRANWFQMAQKLGEDLDAAEKRNAELESSGIAPGILRCTECSFVLTKNIISVTADTITSVESESEPCPNGCGQLQPVTWKALAIQLMFTTKQGVSDLLEAKKRIAELESRTVKLPAERFCPAEYAGSQLWSETEVWNQAISACNSALRTAGIKVEAE